MSTSADDHTEKGVERVQTTIYGSELDDDCVSENSFGSSFGDNAMDEENMTVDIELDSSPPVYSDEEYPQLDDMYARSPSVDLAVVPQYTPSTRSYQPALDEKSSGPSMCVVCKLSPAYSKGGVSYTTCGFSCASRMPMATPWTSQSEISYSEERGNVSHSRLGGSARQIKMCEVCHVRPQAQNAGKIYPTCGFTCAAILSSSSTSIGNVPRPDPLVKSLRKLSLSDHSHVTHHSPQQSSRADRHTSHGQHSSGHSQSPRGITRRQTAPIDRRQVHQPLKCVVCRKPCRDGRYVTCGMKCAETLYTQGNSNPGMCDYCHRRPKFLGHNQCGKTCRDDARVACLLCRCQPKLGRYHLCGRTCKMIATKRTPLLLEARPDHITYTEVELRFKRAWKGSDTCPSIKKVYKIIEDKSFLQPYDQYKGRVGNEVFRYHGTTRSCTLGSQGNTLLCSSTTCALCSILRTSFKVSLANPFGGFGAGVYTSSAANTAYGYSRGGIGAIILTKVVLGTVYKASAYGQAMSCPPGHNSVVFDHQTGTLNETIVYTDDAIRPVFLIIF